MFKKMELTEACNNISILIFNYIKYLKVNEDVFNPDEMEIGKQTLDLLELQKNVLCHYQKVVKTKDLTKEQSKVLDMILLDVQSLHEAISSSIEIVKK